MTSYQEFYNTHIGRGYDVDGWYGWQCWDGYAEYCRYLGVAFAYCTTSNYVKDIWNNRHNNGMLNNFTEVETMQPGDVAVFFEHSATPSSHIAIFHSDAGGGYGWFFGQNQGGTRGPNGGMAFDLCKLPYAATFKTAFRPKTLATTTKTTTKTTQTSTPTPGVSWVSESATMTTHYAIYARTNGPSTSNPSPYLFPAGSKIKYDAYTHANGYVWIRQKRANGGYLYIPTGPSNGKNRTGDAWGTFA